MTAQAGVNALVEEVLPQGGTARRLAGLLAGVGDADHLAQAGDWIIDCATEEELIARFGNGAPRSS